MINHQMLVVIKNLLQERILMTKIMSSIESIRLVCQVDCQMVTLVQQKMQTVGLEAIVQFQNY